MWIIIKSKSNEFYTLKRDFKSKLGIEPEFFLPRLKLQKIKKNKLIYYERPILGNYILCFHPKFNDKNILRNIQYLRGLKYILNGFRNYQEDILNFIGRCKKHEDKNGFIKQNFFNFKTMEKIKFLSGPFTNIIFKIVKGQKGGVKVTDGKINISFANNHYLFETV